MKRTKSEQPIDILLVEDNPAEVELARMAMADSKILNTLHVAPDGIEAMDWLRRKGKYASAPRPDLVLLDLNLPKKDGRELIAEIKADKDLKRIPVVILTMSKDEADIVNCYNHHANCFITKPIDLNQFLEVVKNIEDFWLSIVKLPPKETSNAQ